MRKPWRLKLADGRASDAEVVHRAYVLRDGAMAAAGELAYRFHRRVHVQNTETGERIRVDVAGHVEGDVR